MFLHFRKHRSTIDPDEILADSTSAFDIERMEAYIERPIGRLPSLLFLCVIGIGILYLLWVLGVIQLRDGEKFFTEAQENRFITRSLIAPRGTITDRFGVPFVENVPSFGLAFEREAFIETGGVPEELLQNLSRFLNVPRSFFIEKGFSESPTTASDLPSYAVLSGNIPFETVVAFTAEQSSFPGVSVFESFQRVYRNPYAIAHLVGFVGKVTEEDMRRDSGLEREDTIGKNGIEFWYDDELRGVDGKKFIEIDSFGMETRYKLVQKYKKGSDIKLTADAELQKFIYDTLRSYTKGQKNASVVALDPRDGSVRALVSFPGFDINRFGSSLTTDEFQAVLQNPLKPLFNRAISGEYPSGSVMKPIVAAAALEEGIVDPTQKILTKGFLAVPNPYDPEKESIFNDWKNHGWVNLYDALAVSSNVYFYILGGGFEGRNGLGIERIQRYTSFFGLGSRLGIDLPGEKTGFIPGPESKKITEPDDPVWRVGDTYNVSIGQGGVRVTPLQITSAVAAIANGGTLYQPHVVGAIVDGDTERIVPPKILRERVVSDKSVRHVVAGMRQAAETGTARLLSSIPMEIAAKTGTAQVTGKKPHAWVTVFAPIENPEIAITVMVEHAGEGSTIAMPIMRDIMRWFYEQRVAVEGDLSTVDSEK